MLVCQLNLLKKELNLPDKVLYIKVVKEALDKREHEEFVLALRHKPKFRVYRELEWEGGCEEQRAERSYYNRRHHVCSQRKAFPLGCHDCTPPHTGYKWKLHVCFKSCFLAETVD